MGDAVNTPLDVLMYFLVFGGVPMLIVSIPLAAIALLDWRIQRRLRARTGQDSPSIGKPCTNSQSGLDFSGAAMNDGSDVE